MKPRTLIFRTGLAGGTVMLAVVALVYAQTGDSKPGGSRAGGMTGGMMGGMMGGKGPLPGSGELGFPNQNGHSATVSTTGAMAGPFHMIFSSNGRNCSTCHQPADGMTVSASGLQQRFDASGGTDPIFRTNDGSNCDHNIDVSTVAARRGAYSLLRTRGLIRVALPVPPDADFEVTGVANPYGCGERAVLSMYRRPLPSTNLRFLSSVMWDERESSPQTGTASLTASNHARELPEDLSHQAFDAATGHAEAKQVPPPWRIHVTAFEMDLTTAQAATRAGGVLDAGGARGGVSALEAQPFHIGINDPQGRGFNPVVFDLFGAWNKLQASDPRAAIARGETVFNRKPVIISGVAGLNDVFRNEAVQGHCGTCHNTPNVGNHSVALPVDIGTADVRNPNRVDYLPVFTLRSKVTGKSVETTDPGRALISGRFADVGKVKIPVLRGLSARAPYFHNGSAMTLGDAVKFHDVRFKIGLTESERADLIAFLGAL